MTPAYDICPQNRTGNIASQAMLISDNNNLSTLPSCLNAAHHFHLSMADAKQIIEQQIDAIEQHWASVCDQAELNQADQGFLWRRQFLNPSIFQ